MSTTYSQVHIFSKSTKFEDPLFSCNVFYASTLCGLVILIACPHWRL